MIASLTVSVLSDMKLNQEKCGRVFMLNGLLDDYFTLHAHVGSVN